MKPKFIYLIRHGESVGNVDRDVYSHTPDWKVPLTEKGIDQAREVGSKLYGEVSEYIKNIYGYLYDPVRIYCSPWVRARQTAEQLNVFGVKLYEDPRLREQEWGNFQEEPLKLKIEKERYRFGTFFYRMPMGESGADVYDRVSTYLETLFRDFSKDNFPVAAIIVSHGLTIRCLLMRWFHWSVDEFERHKTPKNCEIIKMELVGDRYELKTPLRIRPAEEMTE